MAGSLDGVRVLELARYQAGPRGGMILSDLGAEVIKIEKLGGEETRKSEPMVRGQSVYLPPIWCCRTSAPESWKGWASAMTGCAN